MSKSYRSVFALLVLSLIIAACGSNNNQPPQGAVAYQPAAPEVQPVAEVQQQPLPPTEAAFDTNAAVNLFNQMGGDVARFEQALNSQGNNVNQLHLARPEAIDFVSVSSRGINQYARSITITDVSVTPPQFVTGWEIGQPVNGYYNPRITFNPVIFGPAYANYVYTPQYPVYSTPAFGVILSPGFAPYSPRWGYGAYPGWYTVRPPMPIVEYRRTVVTRTVREVPRAAQTQTVGNAPRQSAVTPTRDLPAGITTSPTRQLTGDKQYSKDFQVTDRSKGLNNQGFRSTPQPSSPSPVASSASRPSAPPVSRPSVSRPSAPPVSRPSAISTRRR